MKLNDLVQHISTRVPPKRTSPPSPTTPARLAPARCSSALSVRGWMGIPTPKAPTKTAVVRFWWSIGSTCPRTPCRSSPTHPRGAGRHRCGFLRQPRRRAAPHRHYGHKGQDDHRPADRGHHDRGRSALRLHRLQRCRHCRRARGHRQHNARESRAAPAVPQDAGCGRAPLRTGGQQPGAAPPPRGRRAV